jgi:predicted dehydrogenase
VEQKLRVGIAGVPRGITFVPSFRALAETEVVGVPRGITFVPSFRALAETEVVALCDLDRGVLVRAAAETGLELLFTDYEEMLERARLDVVVVATPMPLHVPQTVAALECGIHVLAEVPAATDLEQCWRLVQAGRASRAIFMMAENYCYTRESVLVRALAQAGLFGEVYYGEGGYVHELKALHEITRWRRFWQVGLDGNTYPTHSLGPLLQWMGTRVTTVCCMGSGHHYRDSRGRPYGNQDTTTTLCGLANGGMLTLRLDLVSERPSNGTHYALQGTKGAYLSPRRDEEEPLVWLLGRSPERERWEELWEYAQEFLPDPWRNPGEEAQRAGHGGGDYFEVREFADAVLGGRRSPIDVFDALDFTVPGLVSRESLRRGGQPLPVPDFRTIGRFPDDLPEELRESAILRVVEPERE